MTNEISISKIGEFLASPIVTWFVSCLGEKVKDQLTYEELIDGVLIYDVLLQMDVDGHTNDVSPSQNNPEKHLANLETVMRHIRKFYEDYHGEVILYQPDVRLIVQEPGSNVREIELLLVLLLGCAVKCRNNKHFVEKITLLDDDAQAAIAEYIKKVLYFPELVLSKEMLQFESTLDIENLTYDERITKHEERVNKSFSEISRINKERNELLQQLQSASLRYNDVQRFLKELKEWKSEAITLNDQLDEYKRKVAEIENENKRLASKAKSDREALEDVSERLQQTERLEQEVNNYKTKLKQMGLQKTRIDELERKNQSLKEDKEELKDQLNAHRAESNRKRQTIEKLDKQIHKLEERCKELTMENKASCEENSKLYEENADLREHQIKLSTSMNFTLDDSSSVEAGDESFLGHNSSICEQLSQSVQSHALKLELERLRLETLKENSILKSPHQLIDLENEKKRLELANADSRLKVSQLQENLTSINKEHMQLRGLLEKSASEELKPRVAVLEFEKKDAEKIIEVGLRMKSQDDENHDGDLNNSLAKSPPKHKLEYDQLYNDYQSVLQERDSLQRQLRDAELELASHIKDNSVDDLSREYFYLKKDFACLMNEYNNKQLQTDELTRSHAQCQKDLHARNLKIFELDAQNRQLRVGCELLTEMKNRVEHSNKMLKRYVSQIMKESHKMVAKTRETQKKFHDEDKKKNETLYNLTRTKEKLEGKVMDHYRNMNNTQEFKKHSTTISSVKKTFVKVRRVGSEFFGISKWSRSTDDVGCSKTLDSESCNGISRNDKSFDFFENFSPENFSFDRKDDDSKENDNNKHT